MKNEKINIEVLDSVYCIGKGYAKTQPHKKIDKKSNLIALIISSITKYVPGIERLSEGKFIALQEEIDSIIKKNIKDENILW